MIKQIPKYINPIPSKKRKYLILIIFSVLITTTIWFTWVGGTAHLYALWIESKWGEANPKNKKELEKFLRYYSEHQIHPENSVWGSNYKLQPNERMVQYRILWNKNCPLDIVYDHKAPQQNLWVDWESKL